VFHESKNRDQRIKKDENSCFNRGLKNHDRNSTGFDYTEKYRGKKLKRKILLHQYPRKIECSVIKILPIKLEHYELQRAKRDGKMKDF
jgi:hypothetical protein